MWALTLPEVRLYLKEEEAGETREQARSIHEVTASMNASREAKGLPPLKVVNILDIKPGEIPEQPRPPWAR